MGYEVVPGTSMAASCKQFWRGKSVLYALLTLQELQTFLGWLRCCFICKLCVCKALILLQGCREAISVRLSVILFQVLLPVRMIYFAIEVSSCARVCRVSCVYHWVTEKVFLSFAIDGCRWLFFSGTVVFYFTSAVVFIQCVYLRLVEWLQTAIKLC